VRKILLLVFLLTLLLAACRQPEPMPDTAVQLTLNVEPDPAVVGEGTVIVTVTRAGALIGDANVALRGDMAHAGMTPVLAEVQGSEDGVYRIPFQWTMGGDWFVEVTVTLPDGATAQQRFDVRVSGG
jgi:hypothetical protein